MQRRKTIVPIPTSVTFGCGGNSRPLHLPFWYGETGEALLLWFETFTNFYTSSFAVEQHQDGDQDGTGVAPIQNRAFPQGRAGFNRNHRYIAAVVYGLPVDPGRK